MKPGYRHRVLLVVFPMCLAMNGVWAQSGYDSAYIEAAKMFPEKLLVFTDRTMYAVNEEVRFAAILQSAGDACRGPGSTVIYAELVDGKGSSVLKLKVPLTDDCAVGHLTIPSNLRSGVCYLKCYTRWMRNFGSRTFTYLPLRIISPLSKPTRENSPSAKSRSGSNSTLLTSPGTIPTEGNPLDAERWIPLNSAGIEAIGVTMTGYSYGIKDSMEVKISCNERSHDPVRHLTVTVVPAGSIDTALFMDNMEPDPGQEPPFRFNFLPEVDGTTISGRATRPDDTPASDLGIHFSLFGPRPGYFVAKTDQKGRFQVRTPKRYGTQEMLVVPEHQPGKRIGVQIDDDFSTGPLPFAPLALQLNQHDLDLASRISLNMQLKNAYLTAPEADPTSQKKQTVSHPFYGTPGTSIKIDEFVSLPNLEEIIDNLIPKTYVVGREGSDFLLIKGENPMLSLFPPLILVDHVPVFDTEVLLSIPPSRIDHIDVLREVYVMGDMKYGGIISITSKANDLGGIKLPEDSYFFDYLGLQPPHLLKKAAGTGSIPDTRNTLFWADRLEIAADRPCTIRFQASSVPGKFFILVRGILPDGTLAYGSAQFEVK